MQEESSSTSRLLYSTFSLTASQSTLTSLLISPLNQIKYGLLPWKEPQVSGLLSTVTTRKFSTLRCLTLPAVSVPGVRGAVTWRRYGSNPLTLHQTSTDQVNN